MDRRRVVRAADLRAGVRDLFWSTQAGHAVLALLDDLSLHSLTMQLFDIAGPLLEARDQSRIGFAPAGARHGLPQARIIEFASMPLVAAVLKAAGYDADEVMRRSRERVELASEAQQLVRSFDNVRPGEDTPLFYMHAYNELRLATVVLLREFAGIEVVD